MSTVPPLEHKVPVDFRAKVSPEALEYDFYKWTGMVALVILGGLLTIAATPATAQLPHDGIVIASLLAAAGAIVSFGCQSEIIRLATGERAARRWTRFGPRALSLLFVAGMVLFVLIIWVAL
jgi:hypothetical protein